MTEAAQVFNQEVKERSNVKKSVNNRKHGSSTQKLGNKPMSWQEIRSKHGEEKTYHLERFMDFEEFCAMPKDLQIEYVNKLQDKYDIGIKHISRELFNLGDDGLKTHLWSIRILNECNPDKRRAKSGLQQFKDDILEQERRDEISAMIDQDVKLSRLGRFMTYDEYLTLNPQERLDYVNSLVEKYGVSNRVISEHLFERNANTIFAYFWNNGLHEKSYKISKSASCTEEYKQKVRLFIDAVEQWKHPIKYSEKVVNDTIKEMVNVFGTPEIKNEIRENKETDNGVVQRLMLDIIGESEPEEPVAVTELEPEEIMTEVEQKSEAEESVSYPEQKEPVNNDVCYIATYTSNYRSVGLNSDELDGLKLLFNNKMVEVSISVRVV